MSRLGYVSVTLDKAIEADLIKDLLEIGLTPISKYPYHCTIMYDNAECDEPRCEVDHKKVFQATIQGVEILGDSLAFIMTSKDILDEHFRLREAGYTHSYPSLKIHMSLLYDPVGYDLLLVKQEMGEWIGRSICFTNETIADLE